MSGNIYIYIAIVAITSYLIRVLPLTLIRKPIKNRFIRSFLYYVPYVTLAVMTFPAIIDATATPLAGALALIAGIFMAWKGLGLFPVAIACCIIAYLGGLIFSIKKVPASFFDPGISSIPKVKIKILRFQE